MKITFDGDMPASVGETIPGLEIPEALQGVPPTRLRFVNGRIVDGATLKRFYIDEAGRKHAARPRDANWPAVTCSIDDDVVQDGKQWRETTQSERLAPAIKDECSRRIRSVLKDDATQNNLLAEAISLTRAVAQGKAKVKDKAALDLMESVRQWVREMQGACRAMIAAADEDYAQDGKWPAPPDGVTDLVAQL